ncbi:MAG: hypothetical protein IMZ50_00175 [Candidatus Atribacteria bacterium]|nr:hypothetical protein [Candidatus Atribacteria bacterium]
MSANPKVTIDPDFAALIPPLTADELAGLEASILADGCRDALVTWQGTLLDGHNRYRLCEKHGLAFQTTAIDLPDRDAAKVWIIKNQLGRRNLNTSQRSMLAVELEKVYAEQAKGRQGARTDLNIPAKLPEGSKGEAREQAAKDMNVSPRLVQAAKTVKEEGSEELQQAVAAGKVKVSPAAEIAKLPQPMQAAALAEKLEPTKDKATTTRQSQALVLSCKAIEVLKKIRRNDPRREEALRNVAQWIKDVL